jgi:DNA-binding HxlR family transcriptional regulator
MKKPALATKPACNTCPIEKTADLIGDHWTLLIVRDLLTGPKRFGELETSLDGVSSRTLVKKLGCLTDEGIITRTAFKETPPRVEYTLTKKGKDLNGLAEAMRKYGEKHL